MSVCLHRTGPDWWTTDDGYRVSRIRDDDGTAREYRVYAPGVRGWAGVLSLTEVRDVVAKHRASGNWNGADWRRFQ